MLVVLVVLISSGAAPVPPSRPCSRLAALRADVGERDGGGAGADGDESAGALGEDDDADIPEPLSSARS